MNTEAFKTSILPVKNKLYRLALRITGNPAEAEDVVQEVFIKLWQTRDQLSHIANVEAWCMQLTKNRAIDKTRSRHHQSEDLELAYGFSSNGHNPERELELQDTLGHIKRLMCQLPEAQKMSMELRDIEGLSYEEIADTLQLSLAQVKTNIFRARKTIQSKLLQLWTIKESTR
ncbi:MAG TPA: RNA polymerase sigma factor [Saprospiraceae bacterium]|nr:RNA polymerase sigma factor [Saprospiraceae bacterium]HMQ85415.1 RNA polymerase sigma factor [Saprospiraceae bacterium]